MGEQAITLIQPARVERHAGGCWWHPDLPCFEEGDGVIAAWGQWLDAQQLQAQLVLLADQFPELLEHYFSSVEGFDCWQPQAPEGDGWFLLCLADTEDGPAAWWARRVTP